MNVEKEENKYYSKNRSIRAFQKRYVREFEKFIKSKLKTQYLFRSMDDFVILWPDKMRKECINRLKSMLHER